MLEAVFGVWKNLLRKVDGVLSVTSGYSGGTTVNPTYEEVTYGDTGHFEVIEIKYDSKKINYEKVY